MAQDTGKNSITTLWSVLDLIWNDVLIICQNDVKIILLDDLKCKSFIYNRQLKYATNCIQKCDIIKQAHIYKSNYHV